MSNAIDWQAAMDGTRPVTTYDGLKVTLYCVDAPGFKPIHGRIEGYYTPDSWTIDGRYNHIVGASTADLIQPSPAPKPFRREFWVNVYGERAMLLTRVGSPHLTKADACEAAPVNAPRIACVRVVLEGREGDGL